MARLLLSLLLLLLAGNAAAQYPAKAHMEGCLVWTVAKGNLVVRNECSRPLTLMFMSFDDGRTVQSEVAPGAWFDTGRRMGDVELGARLHVLTMQRSPKGGVRGVLVTKR